jgi:hypothetical protein
MSVLIEVVINTDNIANFQLLIMQYTSYIGFFFVRVI